MTCGFKIGRNGAAIMGTAVGVTITVHEVEAHGGRDRCRPARIEFVAVLAHMLHIRPSELEDVKRQMLDHLRTGCMCGEGRELET